MPPEETLSQELPTEQTKQVAASEPSAIDYDSEICALRGAEAAIKEALNKLKAKVVNTVTDGDLVGFASPRDQAVSLEFDAAETSIVVAVQKIIDRI